MDQYQEIIQRQLNEAYQRLAYLEEEIKRLDKILRLKERDKSNGHSNNPKK
ncbi:MAG: hypothetical protein M1136_00940 [Chloroflexi bacterium]|nr:hypothetical protein [Chloroflexota bacterium]